MTARSFKHDMTIPIANQNYFGKRIKRSEWSRDRIGLPDRQLFAAMILNPDFILVQR